MAGQTEKITGVIVTGLFSVAVAMLGASVLDRFYYPIVEVALEENPDAGDPELIITITNYGSKAADNLTLFIKSPHSNFTSITNKFSTVDITMTNFSDNSLESLEVNQSIPTSALNSHNYFELFIKKFVHGTGSKAVLNLKAEELEWADFEASAIYDQGSARWVEAGEWTYKGFVDNITKPKAVLFLLFVAIAAVIELVLFVKGRLDDKIIQVPLLIVFIVVAIVILIGVD